MQPIAKQRIDASVYEQVLANIKNGVWKSGDKLPSESELCNILQVSRVSVRSALQRLQTLGLIEIRRGKGSFVRSPEELFDFSNFNDADFNLSEREFRDTAELRDMLESAAVEIILSREEKADLSTVTEAYREMAAAIETMDLDRFTRNDHKFHQAIVSASGNDILARIAHIFRENLFAFIRESNKFILRDSDNPEKVRRHFADSLVWHTELCDALIRHDKRAIEIQRRHLKRNIERLVHYFQRHPKGNTKKDG